MWDFLTSLFNYLLDLVCNSHCLFIFQGFSVLHVRYVTLIVVLLVSKRRSSLTTCSNNAFNIIWLLIILILNLLNEIRTLLIYSVLRRRNDFLLFLNFKWFTLRFRIINLVNSLIILYQQLFKLLLMMFVISLLNVLRIVSD